MALSYDYDKGITKTFSKDDHKNEIIINKVINSKLTRNVFINKIDYYIKSIQFFISDSSNILIIKNESVNERNTLHIIIQIKKSDGTDPPNPNIDILYNAASNGGKDITFDLTELINSSLTLGQATYNMAGSNINVLTPAVYTSASISGVSTNLPLGVAVSAGNPIIMQHTGLDWNVTFDYQRTEGDDNDDEIVKNDDPKTGENKTVDALDHMIFIITMLLVCSVAYVAIPMGYSSFLKWWFRSRYPLGFIEKYWLAFGSVSALVMYVYSLVSKNPNFGFATFAIIMFFISARMSIENSIGNIYSKHNTSFIQIDPKDKPKLGPFTKLMDSSNSIPIIDLPFMDMKNHIFPFILYLMSIVLMFLSLLGSIDNNDPDAVFISIYVIAYVVAIVAFLLRVRDVN